MLHLTFSLFRPSTSRRRFLTTATALVPLLLLGTLGTAFAQNEQSPIDIRSDHTTFMNLPGLQFSYSTDTNLNVVNTGSPDVEKQVRANVTGGAGSLTLSGDTYNLLQFHFHTPSEHLLNGQDFPMEMHMVHSDAEGHLLVVGRWIKEGAANLALDPIFSNLPPDTLTPSTINDFDLTSLLPSSLKSYRYPGSLTTPPFTEGVQWIVMDEPLEVSPEQIQAFQALFPEGNSREIQDIKARGIVTDVAGFAAPEPGSIALLLVSGLPILGIVRRRKH